MEFTMTTATYRVESAHPIIGPLWPSLASSTLRHVFDRALAIVLAAKSMTRPSGHEIRVVHVPTGNVIFRKTAEVTTDVGDGSY
jgi:hypothetical protein